MGLVEVEGMTRDAAAESNARVPSQRERILARLRLGDATNAELSELSLKYTGRISDLRALGYDIKVVEHDRENGRVVYRLTWPPVAPPPVATAPPASSPTQESLF